MLIFPIPFPDSTPETSDYHCMPGKLQSLLNHCFYMIVTMPIFCLIFPSYQVQSQPGLLFSIYNMVPLYIFSFVLLYCAYDSHSCPYIIPSLRFLHSLTQFYLFLKFIFYSFSEIILNTSSFILLSSDQEFPRLGSFLVLLV